MKAYSCKGNGTCFSFPALIEYWEIFPTINKINTHKQQEKKLEVVGGCGFFHSMIWNRHLYPKKKEDLEQTPRKMDNQKSREI